jgi:hypothetical protein
MAFVLALLAFLTAPSTSAPTPAFALACQRNPSLGSYTFHMHVALAMHQFPWLHFRIEGTGQHVRGELYVVHLTRMPFFAKGFSTIDLSPLDPRMWKKQYLVQLVDRNDRTTTFLLHERAQDPQEKDPLKSALVTLDESYATREVVLQYANGGEILLELTPSNASGYRLPATADAQIHMLGETLTAHADFTDYAISYRPTAS